MRSPASSLVDGVNFVPPLGRSAEGGAPVPTAEARLGFAVADSETGPSSSTELGGTELPLTPGNSMADGEVYTLPDSNPEGKYCDPTVASSGAGAVVVLGPSYNVLDPC